MHKPWLSGGGQEKVLPLNSLGLDANPFSAPSVVANSFFLDYILQENVTESWSGGKIERAIEEEGERERGREGDEEECDVPMYM